MNASAIDKGSLRLSLFNFNMLKLFSANSNKHMYFKDLLQKLFLGSKYFLI
jgi:hypothetical protein